MANARIERMIRELDCDPSHQFFSALFGLIGLGKDEKPASQESSAPAYQRVQGELA